jgi:hypothetical protein
MTVVEAGSARLGRIVKHYCQPIFGARQRVPQVIAQRIETGIVKKLRQSILPAVVSCPRFCRQTGSGTDHSRSSRIAFANSRA